MRSIRRFGFLFLSICSVTALVASRQKENVASLRGQVYADRLGLPFSNAKVQLYSDGKLINTALSDEVGRYKIDNLKPGRYTVVGELAGTNLKKRLIEIHAGEQMLLNIGLKAGSLGGTPPSSTFILTGVVTQANRTPVNDAAITVISPYDQEIVARGVTDRTGRYEVSVDFGEQFIVIASKPGFLASTLNSYFRDRNDLELSPLRLRP